MAKITVAIAQMKVVPARPDENLERAEEFIAQAVRRGSTLICFPEMWTTGFDWDFNRRSLAEHERVIGRVGELARRYSLWITGSLLARDERGEATNAAILFNPGGERVAVYRKTHLFSLFGEDRHVTPGKKLVVADTPWGKAGFSICYDLRFPELFRACALRGAVTQILPAAWPHPRREHWKVLTRARAIENQFFMVAANRSGEEDIPGSGRVT
jgi:predicted amidohydrolase